MIKAQALASSSFYELLVSRSAEKIFATFFIESDTILSEDILPGVGVPKCVEHSRFVELEGYARSDGYTHIKELEE